MNAGVVYLLHFDAPISDRHTCQHYLGYSEDLLPRIWAHMHGDGARLTAVAKERGIGFVVARTWEGATRTDERKLKDRHAAPALCPICNCRHPLQVGLFPDAPCFVPVATVEGMVTP